MPPSLRPAIKAGNIVLASGVAWARVETQRHYPSDVLAGAALGHFLTAFIHDAFLNLPEDRDAAFAVFPVEGGAGVELAFRFWARMRPLQYDFICKIAVFVFDNPLLL